MEKILIFRDMGMKRNRIKWSLANFANSFISNDLIECLDIIEKEQVRNSSATRSL